MSVPSPYDKPSRQNRRQKRGWQRKKSALAGLTLSTSARHHPSRLQTTGNGIGVPKSRRTRPPQSGFFASVIRMARSINGETVGKSRKARLLLDQVRQFSTVLAAPLAWGAGSSNRCQGASAMRYLASGTHAHAFKSRFAQYRFLRLFVRPALAFRLTFGGRA